MEIAKNPYIKESKPFLILSAPKDGSKDTHLIKQSFSKEKFAAMSEDEKKAIPIMGNAIAWGGETVAPKESKPAEKPSWL